MQHNTEGTCAEHWANHQWNAERADNPIGLRTFIPDTGTHPPSGMTLPRRAWVRLSRLRTGVGRFRSCLYKWGMASSAACECGAEEQTVDHVGRWLIIMYWASFFSFIFLPTFPLERVAEAVDQGGLEIPQGQQQSQIVLLAQHQEGTKQGRKCYHSTWSLDVLLAVFPGVQPAGLASPIFSEHSGQMAEPTYLSIRRSGSRISQPRTLSRSVTPRTPERATQPEYRPLTFQKGSRAAEGHFDNSIIGNSTAYQDKL